MLTIPETFRGGSLLSTMKRLKDFLGASIPLAIGVVFLGAASQSASAACLLNSPGGQVKHVVHIVFDNVHLATRSYK